MNGSETGTVEYSTELAFNMHLIRQFNSVHVKCDF